MLFLSFDTDRSGKMSSYELRTALKAAGENQVLLLQPEPGWGAFVYRTLTLTLGAVPSTFIFIDFDTRLTMLELHLFT